MTGYYKAQRLPSIGLLLGTAFLWSLGGVLIKQIGWSAMAIAGTRCAIAIPVLLIIFRKSHLTWSAAQLIGAAAYAATLILFVCATKLTTAANAILLQYTAPIYVALFSACFLGERATRLDWMIIGIALSGVVLFFLDKLTPGNWWGNILAVLSGVSFATMILCMRKQKSSFPLGSIFLGNVITVLICLPFMLRSQPGQGDWLYLSILGLFQVGVAYIMYSAAIRRVTAMQAILIPMIETGLNPMWTFIFLDEQPGRWAIVGGIIIVSSVVVRTVISTPQDQVNRQEA
jgi:drug/metabolite transporter (DMT)-like permease